MAQQLLRLAVFSPVPPVASGISDYLVDLLPQLPESWQIEVFVGDDVEPVDPALAGRARCWAHRQWGPRHAERPFDLNLYQVGNNVAHAYTLPYVLSHPGLLVLHDAVLHPARALATIGARDLDGYRRVARGCRPGRGRLLGHLVAGGLTGPAMLWRFPLCEDLVRASRLTVAHGPLLAGWIRALVPGAAVGTVVHWRRTPEASAEGIAAWRERCGASDDTPLVGCFGQFRASHRLDVVVDALADVASDARFRIVVVGSVDPALGVAERAAARGLDERISWVGRVSEDDFGALMRSVDVAINLRYPTARSSSGVLQQLLQVGVPVVISDLIHQREIPDAAVLRVPPGTRESERGVLAERLRYWLTDPARRASAGEAARRWAADHITPELMGRSYVRAVQLALGDTAAA